MNTLSNNEKIRNAYKTIQIIWGGLTASVVMYAVVAHILLNSGFKPLMPDVSKSVLLTSIIVVSVVLVIVATQIRGRIGIKGDAPHRTLPTIEITDNMIMDTIRKYNTGIIIYSALAESVGFFGLVYFLMTGGMNELYVFSAVSVAVLVKGRPRPPLY